MAGIAVGAGVLGLVELLAHLVLGPPPPLVQVTRMRDCDLEAAPEGATLVCTDGVRRPIPAKGDRPRVVVLGGSSVQDPFSEIPPFASRLGDRLPQVEVLNLGRAGANAAHLARTAGQLSLIDPDLVIVYTGHNDYSSTVFGGLAARGGADSTDTLLVLQRSWIFQALSAWLAPVRWSHPNLAGNGAPPAGAVGPPGGPPSGAGGPPPGPPPKMPTGGPGQGVGPPVPQPGSPTGGPVAQPREGPKEPPMPMGPELAPLCVLPDLETRWWTSSVVDDTSAFAVRAQIEAGLRADLKAIVARSPAPVVLLTILRNAEYPPTATLAADPLECTRLIACIGAKPPDTSWAEIARQADTRCGTEAAWSLWAHAQAARVAGDGAAQVSSFRASLDADPRALRAPTTADAIVQEVAAEGGVTLVDLGELIGLAPPGLLFTDQLHLSAEGHERVTDALEPVVRQALGLGGG